MKEKVEIGKLAKIIRSKNAGPFKITLDIIFNDLETYKKVKKSEVINRKLVSKLYNLPNDADISIVGFDKAAAIKVTFQRLIASGSAGDSDIYGAQQHVPLCNIKILWN